MEIQMEKQVEEYDIYSSVKANLSGSEFLETDDDPKSWESTWFYMCSPCTETMRICAVVSLLVYELEQNKVTPEMIGELDYYYYEVFVQKSMDNLFKVEKARDNCLKDLKWCYKTAKERKLL